MVPSSNYAGMNNPSYVLLRRNDGYTFAKFVGTNYDDYAWTIWVPKTLVANSLGPIEKWGPKKILIVAGLCLRWNPMGD